MTKADKILIACIMVLAVGLVFPLLGHAPQSNQAVVSVKNKEVLRINLNQNANYSVNGKLGKVKIQVKDGKFAYGKRTVPTIFAANKAMYLIPIRLLFACLMRR